MKRWVIVCFVTSILASVGYWAITSKLWMLPNDREKVVEIKVWGMAEEEPIFKPILEEYMSLRPNIRVTFIRQSPVNYRTRLQAQLLSDKGPDVFPIHYSWIPLVKGQLAQAPESVVSMAELSNNFYPVNKQRLASGNQILALPRELDGLVMFYNEDILKAANVVIPKTWEEFIEAARKMTVKDTDGRIQTAGAALGTINNIDYWPEIIGVLFLQQPKANLFNPASADGADAVRFYTNFVIDPKNKVWDQNLPKDSQMFSRGNLAFYFGPIKQAKEFKQVNPNLKFKTDLIPQLPNKNISWATFNIWAVSSRSDNQKTAWELVKYLTSPNTLQFIADQRRQILGELTVSPRVEMGKQYKDDSLLASVVAQGTGFQGGYLNSKTGDGVLNDEMIKLYGSAVNGVLLGQDPLAALQSITPGIQKLVTEYELEASNF